MAIEVPPISLRLRDFYGISPAGSVFDTELPPTQIPCFLRLFGSEIEHNFKGMKPVARLRLQRGFNMTTKSHGESNENEAVRPEETLVAAAIDGDESAFEDLVSGHVHDAVRVAAEIVGLNLAEGVVQKAVLLARRDLASLQDRTSFPRWFLSITRWQALRVERLERRRPFGRVSLVETVLETLSRLASDPRLTGAGDGLLLARLSR